MIFVVSFVFMALFIGLLSLGVIFQGKVLKGSCGGLGKIMGSKCSFCEKKDSCQRKAQSAS